MCGRFVQQSTLETLVDHFAIDVVTCEVEPRYNVAPTQEVLAIVAHEGKRRLGKLRWGLVPHWAEEASAAGRLINARSETAHEKPSFRTAFRRHRCLIPADGFYEWKKAGYGPKQPFFIHRPDREPFAMAGLWDIWREGENDYRSCTVLTRPAEGPTAELHDRMPVILDGESHDGWLDPEAQAVDALRRLLAEKAVTDLDFYPVSPRMNKPSHDAPDCVEPVNADDSGEDGPVS
ncbi:MAG: SOS response-associated peptidase [Desulfococcaceae bacterium]